MATVLRQRSITIFLSGLLCGLALLLLTGAMTSEPVGKYQLEAITRDRATLVYVIDTTSGTVKWVDSFNTPFQELKGE